MVTCCLMFSLETTREISGYFIILYYAEVNSHMLIS